MLNLTDDSLEYALTHVIARGDTDILPPAHEFNAIFEDWDSIRDYLAKTDLDNWNVRPLRSCLSPKRGLGFRIATQLDPLDTLIVTALVSEVGSDLESRRVPPESNVVHSYRFAPTANGQMYRPDINFDSFRATSLELAERLGGFVLMTDIADFFQRVYHHRLENALRVSTPKSDHARVITKLLSAWNQTESHSIPVGPAAIRLLAEITIDDVDRALLSEGYVFCRFSDDYRIFVNSEGEARKACAFLANTLFRHHGLTLQESKTEIIDAERFVERFQRTEEDAAKSALEDQFESLLEQLRVREGARVEEADEEEDDDDEEEDDDDEDIDASDQDGVSFWDLFSLDEYEHLAYDDLDAEQQAIVDGLNLWEIIRTEIEGDSALDVPLARFVLRRIAQLSLIGDYELLLSNIKRIYPVFPEIVAALAAQGDAQPELRAAVGDRLLTLLEDPIVGHLEYHRCWILSVFTHDAEWNHVERLMKIYSKYADQMTRPEVTLALGAGAADHWFRGRKIDVVSLPPWERRAFLAGARCLPKDEAKHWLRSVAPQVDRLDQTIIRWAGRRAT